MAGSEFGWVGLLFALGPVVGELEMGMAYNCTIEGREGSMVSYALGDSPASATLDGNQ